MSPDAVALRSETTRLPRAANRAATVIRAATVRERNPNRAATVRERLSVSVLRKPTRSLHGTVAATVPKPHTTRRFCLPILFLLAWSCIASTLRAGPIELARSRLQDLAAKRRRVPAFFQRTVTLRYEGDRVQRSTSRIYEKRADGRRLIRLDTEMSVRTGKQPWRKTGRILAVSDGKHQWDVSETHGETLVIESKARPVLVHDQLLKMVEKDRVRYVGREAILIRPCLVFEARNATGAEASVTRYWIDERTGLVLKTETRKAGRLVAEKNTEDLTLDASLDDDLFTYRPPPDARVIHSLPP